MNITLNTFRPAMAAVVLGGALLASPGTVQAGPPSAVTKAKTAATVLVSVPAHGKPVTYRVGQQIWTVQPGQSMVLPAGATRIMLPAGTILTTSIPSAKSMEPTRFSYTVNKSITLVSLTPEAILAFSTAFSPGSDSTAAGDIQHPSLAIKNLIDAVTSASSSTVNPFNVLGDAVTDGNNNVTPSNYVTPPRP